MADLQTEEINFLKLCHHALLFLKYCEEKNGCCSQIRKSTRKSQGDQGAGKNLKERQENSETERN